MGTYRDFKFQAVMTENIYNINIKRISEILIYYRVI